MAIIDVKTSSGFECSLDDTRMDDAELLECFLDVDNGDMMAFPKIMSKVFGDEIKAKLYDHVRTEDGRVPYDALGVELGEILPQLSTKKK